MLTPPTSPDITIIICTRNRAAPLSRVLHSVAALRPPAGAQWEILIVNNGSTDGTDDVAKSFQDRLPLRLVREDRPGLSNARNRGVAEAAGRYICWTDDDVLLDPEWLAAYWSAFQRHPEAAIFGGRITPVLDAPTPGWFAELAGEWPIKNVLAKRDFGEELRPLDFESGIVPWGANFALRTAEQRRQLYEPGLGVSPLHRRVGEETEVIYRLMASGATGWWVPGAKVSHLIPIQRQSWAYIYEYSLASGETLAYMQHAWPDAHHMASESRDLARICRPVTELKARALAYRVLSDLARRLGAAHRGARLLAVAGLYEGASRFRRSLA